MEITPTLTKPEANRPLNRRQRRQLASLKVIPEPTPVTAVKRRGRPPKNTATVRPNLPTSGLEKSAVTTNPLDSEAPPVDIPPFGMTPQSEPDDETPRRVTKLEREVASLYMGMGMLLMAYQPADGIILIQGAVLRAREVCAVADRHPEFKRFLKRLTAGTVYSALIIGHATMVQAILKNHDIDAVASVRKLFTPRRVVDDNVRAPDVQAVYPGARHMPSSEDLPSTNGGSATPLETGAPGVPLTEAQARELANVLGMMGRPERP